MILEALRTARGIGARCSDSLLADGELQTQGNRVDAMTHFEIYCGGLLHSRVYVLCQRFRGIIVEKAIVHGVSLVIKNDGIGCDARWKSS
jgi:hypothetical protein